MKRNIPFLISSTALLFVVAAELESILSMNNGVLTYVLDDAYIHLSVAEHVARGEYGINPGEFSSPSSSIIWPFLLAPFSILPFFTIIPLLLNIACSLGTLFVIWKIFDAVYEETPVNTVIATFFLMLIIMATGMAGLIFSGMEQSLQIFSVILVLYGLVRELRGNGQPMVLAASIVLASVVRYENLSVVMFALALLYSRGRKRETAFAVIGIFSLHALFALMLYYHTSAVLPSSVLLKTDLMQTGFLYLPKFFRALKTTFGGFYFAIALLMIIYFVLNRKVALYTELFLGCAFIVFLHLLRGYTQMLGDFSTEFVYFYRYEMYLWTYILVTAMIVLAKPIQRFFRFSPALFFSTIIVAELFFCARVNSVVWSIPTASNNIYEQQYQNHRFVTELYRKPVAVNDIGYVSYRNDITVFDLWGLALYDVGKVRLEHPMDVRWMDSVITSRSIDLAIIYDVWFPIVPSSWRRLAELSVTKRSVTVSEGIVSYYATRESAVQEIQGALVRFRTLLPDSSMLTMIHPFDTPVSSPATNSIPEHTLSAPAQ